MTSTPPSSPAQPPAEPEEETSFSRKGGLEPEWEETEDSDPEAWPSESLEDEFSGEGDDSPQQYPETGVMNGMASAALNYSLPQPQSPLDDARTSPSAKTGAGIPSGIRSETSAAFDGRQLADAQAVHPGEAVREDVGGLPSAAAGPTDAEIMLRVREGDDSGFDLLIAKYRKPIIHFMYRMVHNQGVAEELAQEVFLRVYRSRATYRAEARFSTWLYRIATNLGVNHARDTKHERAASNVYLDEPDPETGSRPDLADSTPTIEQDMVRREQLKAIRQHVLALPDRQRAAVLMHKYEGMDYKQIGEVLKLSESATKSLLFRAYQSLRDKLKDFV